MSGRTLAIGDIHGCDLALASVLALVEPTGDDTLVVLGDVIDRGAGSSQAIDQLLELSQSLRVVFIRGNHEEMMLEAVSNRQWREAWLRYGGSNTLFSYGGSLDAVPETHWEFLRSSINYYETPGTVFLHANLEPGVELRAQSPEWLRWTHLSGLEKPLTTGQQVVCGHTPQKSGLPLTLPGWIDIDTYACGSGWLTVLDVDSQRVFQANEQKKTRVFLLGESPTET